jgi:Peptidase family M1 domain
VQGFAFLKYVPVSKECIGQRLKQLSFIFAAMKKMIAISVLLLAMKTAVAQQYWQQEVNYTINVSLDDAAHAVKGNITMEYINNSPDELAFIWIHLWPNAYKNNNTALYRQVANDKDGKAKLKSFKERGYIDSLAFTVNGKAAGTENDPANIDVIKLVLPTPLATGGKINISTPFYTKFPSYFSRMGHVEQYYMVTQWYPKPAVYDRKGWHPMPYLDQGEFYSEFGSFDVSITLPSAYVVAATGNLETAEELLAYKTSGSANRKMLDSVLRNNSDETDIKDAVKRLNLAKSATAFNKGSKTLRFTETRVHDFAWFACKDFFVQYDTLAQKGALIDVFSFHHPESSTQWYNSSHFIKDAVKHYSGYIGDYPYKTVKALEGPKNQSSGGMEYPTVTLITSPDATQEALDGVIAHEVGHNWLYGILATNEREHPWMDEGINTYYHFRYEAEKYRANSVFGNDIPKEIRELPVGSFQATIYSVINKNIPMQDPIETASEKFSSKELYGIVVYLKTALWMHILESSISKNEVDKAIQAYYSAWKFRHPYPEDFKDIFKKEIPNKNLDTFFDLLNKKDRLQ